MLHLERTREILLTLRGIIWLSGLDALATPSRGSDVLQEHRAVVDALAERDPDKAQWAIRQHVERTRHATAERLREVRGDHSAAVGPAALDGSRNREEILVISPEDLQTHGKVDTRNWPR
jgi:hypothetical protein